MEEVQLLGRLENFLKEKKGTEAVAVIQNPTFQKTFGSHMTRSIETSISSGNYDEALELAVAMKSFLTTMHSKLRQPSRPNFGIAPLPDGDW